MRTLLKRTIAGLALAVGVLASGTTASAAFFTPVASGTIDQNFGAGFWDGDSDDFTHLTPGGNASGNIGNFLLGDGAFAVGSGTGPLYEGQGVGLPGISYLDAPGFTLSADAPNTSILIEVAGFAGTNQLWNWDLVAGVTVGNPDLVIDGNDPSGTISIALGATETELILLETQNNRAFSSRGFYYTYTDANPLDDGGPTSDALWYTTITGTVALTNFAAFIDSSGTNPGVWIGMEDLLHDDDDFQDMVIHLLEPDGDDIVPTPAPPALVLAVVGIVPCLALRRRLRSQTA
jgi:hypothetical protein